MQRQQLWSIYMRAQATWNILRFSNEVFDNFRLQNKTIYILVNPAQCRWSNVEIVKNTDARVLSNIYTCTDSVAYWYYLLSDLLIFVVIKA